MELIELDKQFAAGVIDRHLHLLDINIHGSEALQVFTGIIDYDLKGLDFVVLVLLLVANATNDALLDAFGLNAN